jgi:hypothetical protein
MKFATMRVQVPVDDALPVQAVHEHLRKVLEERGTEAVPLPRPTNGTDLINGLPQLGRVHWTAVDVVQMQERAAPKPKPKTRGAARAGA